MTQEHQRLLDRLGDAFINGRMDFVTSCFAYPLPVFEKGELVVFGSADTLKEGLQIYLDTVRALGVTEMRGRIVAEGLPINGYFNIWVEWDHFDDTGDCLCQAQVRYVMQELPGALFPLIEVADYTVVEMPQTATAPAQAQPPAT